MGYVCGEIREGSGLSFSLRVLEATIREIQETIIGGQ